MNVPVRILIQGGSMYPLIRMNRDYVTVMPLQGNAAEGDIVLFAGPGEERYVLHRVWRVRENKVLTCGDNCPSADGWMPMDAVWGKVTLIERGERRIHPHPRLGMMWGWSWHQAMKVYRLRERIKSTIRRRKKG